MRSMKIKKYIVKIYLINQKKPICVVKVLNDELIPSLINDMNNKELTFIVFGQICFQRTRVERIEIIER